MFLAEITECGMLLSVGIPQYSTSDLSSIQLESEFSSFFKYMCGFKNAADMSTYLAIMFVTSFESGGLSPQSYFLVWHIAHGHA